jgi:hypothetical protein
VTNNVWQKFSKSNFNKFCKSRQAGRQAGWLAGRQAGRHKFTLALFSYTSKSLKELEISLSPEGLLISLLHETI